jgi:hypothetical protein
VAQSVMTSGLCVQGSNMEGCQGATGVKENFHRRLKEIGRLGIGSTHLLMCTSEGEGMTWECQLTFLGLSFFQ